MNNKIYQPNYTISLLCEHKKQYQKNILFAWLIIFLLTSFVCYLLITNNDSYNDNNNLMVSSPLNNNIDRDNYQIPKGASIGTFVNSDNSFFPTGGKVKYNIIKGSSPTFTNSVHKSSSKIFAELEYTGMNNFRSQYSETHYNDDDDFGLPVATTMIDIYSTKRHSYLSGITRINLPDKNRIACIDWVNPRWPKNGRGVDAVVSIMVYVSSKGKKDCKIIKEEYPVYGFGKALLEAINESIFWPAKDIYGNKLGGSYLITFEFCEDCKENTVEILSGDLVIKPRRRL